MTEEASVALKFKNYKCDKLVDICVYVHHSPYKDI